MTLTAEDRKVAAAALANAERDRVPIPPLTDRWPDLDVADAYQIQLANVAERVGQGRVVKGHKVGLSALAMQRMLGVDEPDYGHLLDDMFLLEGAKIPAAELCFPRVEVEVAFVLGARLAGPGITAADVLRATDFVLPAIEVIDSRIDNWRIKLPDTIADNASSARVVLGASPTRLTDIDVRAIGVLLSRNGEIVETGAAGAVLGNPVTAVAWLANKVAAFGVTLEPGHVVMPGSCTRAVDVVAGDTIRGDFDRLGSVTVIFS